MTKEKLADLLQGCEYPNIASKEEIQLAKDNDLVIVRGHSDDVGMFEGAWYDEFYDKVKVDENGLISSLCDADRDDCPYFQRELERHKYWIDLAFCGDDFSSGWLFTTNMSHATFEVFEDGAVFQKALVIDLKEVFDV